MTIEDVEQASILLGLGVIGKQEFLNITLKYAMQQDNPLVIYAKNRLRTKESEADNE